MKNKNLTIDFGNTKAKIALFENNIIHVEKTILNSDQLEIEHFIAKYINEIKNVIVVSVIDLKDETKNYLNKNFEWILFNHHSPIPINNKYQSPETLGMDRLASVIGTRIHFKSGNILSIDSGTCITYDFLNAKNEYLGGGISPGLLMRFKALNNFTEKLPLIATIEETNLIGTNTKESMMSGVLNGAAAEMDGIINNYKNSYPDLNVVLTGGDHLYFATRLKNRIFAAPHLVLEGLNEVLNYNTK